VEFAITASLEAAIAASPIELDSTTRIVVEERRKSVKLNDQKIARQGPSDRRSGGRSEDSRTNTPKKTGHGASVSSTPKQNLE